MASSKWKKYRLYKKSLLEAFVLLTIKQRLHRVIHYLVAVNVLAAYFY